MILLDTLAILTCIIARLFCFLHTLHFRSRYRFLCQVDLLPSLHFEIGLWPNAWHGTSRSKCLPTKIGLTKRMVALWRASSSSAGQAKTSMSQKERTKRGELCRHLWTVTMTMLLQSTTVRVIESFMSFWILSPLLGVQIRTPLFLVSSWHKRLRVHAWRSQVKSMEGGSFSNKTGLHSVK